MGLWPLGFIPSVCVIGSRQYIAFMHQRRILDDMLVNLEHSQTLHASLHYSCDSIMLSVR